MEFYRQNREDLIQQMEEKSVAIVFSGQTAHRSADSFFPFLVNRNFYYLTALEQENIVLLIIKKQGEVQEELFISQSDVLLEKWMGKKYSKKEVQDISGITHIHWLDNFEKRLLQLMNEYEYENIYLDLEKNQWENGSQKGLIFSKEIAEKAPYLDIKNLFPLVRDLRMIKSAQEIENIKKAIRLTAKGIDSIMREMKAGLREYQLEALFDFTIKYAGARDRAFDTIVAGGNNATILHYTENKDFLTEGDLVLFDLGADFQHYCADISRTLPVGGKYTQRQRELYEMVLKVQDEVIKAIKPGIHFSELNRIAIKVLSEECLKIKLIDRPEEISKYYYHGVSHYLGLDTHDVGRRDRKLEAGMVLTVEPGIYIQEEGIGIRIEDNVLVTKEGREVLSKAIPKTIEEIEQIMQNAGS